MQLMEPIFFADADEWRAWLAAHHDARTEVLVGFHKKATGKPSMTWSDAVDQALCFGGSTVSASLGPDAYTNRFTPRRPGSNWSDVNVAKVEDLTWRGLMHPPGWPPTPTATRPGPACTPSRTATTDWPSTRPSSEAQEGLGLVRSQPPGYRKQAAHWVRSAKREETRRMPRKPHRRLAAPASA